MRVLQVGAIKESQFAAGPSQSIRKLACAQARIGMEVGLVSSFVIDKNARVEGLDGVRFIGSANKRQRLPWFGNDDWLGRIEENFGRPDIVNFHSTYIPFNMAMAKLCRKAGWPYVITPRGGMTKLAQSVKGFKKQIANFICYKSYIKHAAGIHALCRSEAEDIEQLFKPKRMFVVPNGVDDELLEASSRLEPVKLEGFNYCENVILGFIGRIDVFHKGLDLLLEAMSLLKKKFGSSKVKLFIVGPYHTKKDEDRLCSLIEGFGLKDDIKLLGPKYKDEKFQCFLASDVFVHTSRFEGMPMSVLEAMALGKPCLVTPGTNVADMVVKGGGWECQPTADSIANVIKSIVECSPETIEEAGKKARDLVEKDYKWEHVAGKMADEYAKIIEKGKY